MVAALNKAAQPKSLERRKDQRFIQTGLVSLIKNQEQCKIQIQPYGACMQYQNSVPTGNVASNSIQTASNPQETLLRCKDVEHRTALSRSRIYDLMGKGEFPRPVRLGSMSVAWSSQEINNWIAQRLVQREEQL